MSTGDPLLKKVDCVQIPVPDLDEGLRFYRDGLGLELKWRHTTQAGLRLGDTELVLQTEPGADGEHSYSQSTGESDAR